MPRKADNQLEGRIIDAAYQLWSKGGEHAVTMRAVALAAKTTTPTLYERFQDKHDLIVFMRVRARERMFAALQPAKSSVEVCRLGLEFAIANGNEYLLLTSDWAERFARRERLPSYEYVQEKLAADLGGTSGRLCATCACAGRGGAWDCDFASGRASRRCHREGIQARVPGGVRGADRVRRQENWRSHV